MKLLRGVVLALLVLVLVLVFLPSKGGAGAFQYKQRFMSDPVFLPAHAGMFNDVSGKDSTIVYVSDAILEGLQDAKGQRA